MAIVRKLEQGTLQRETPHSEATCTYTIIHDDSGLAYLQIDTYGSQSRQIVGKKSQSVRFAPEAIDQLKTLLAEHF